MANITKSLERLSRDSAGNVTIEFGLVSFGMPDARKPHFPNVRVGSKAEVSRNRGNVRFRG